MQNQLNQRREKGLGEAMLLSPAWIKFIDFCDEIGHGEIANLKICGGLPVLAEKVIQKTKFA